MSCAKTSEPIKMPWWGVGCWCGDSDGPKEPCFTWGPVSPKERAIWGMLKCGRLSTLIDFASAFIAVPFSHLIVTSLAECSFAGHHHEACLVDTCLLPVHVT